MRTLFAIALSLVLIGARAQMADPAIPHLDKRNGQMQLIVDGKPFLMLAAELHNSATGSAHRMAPVWQQMADKNFNTVLAPVSWELLEPEEGKFDFTQVDNMIKGARKAGLKLGILWFGSWKNGLSTYAPSWVKQDARRFPLASFINGQKVNILSTLGRETMEADARAFTAMMAHIKETDYDHTVILVQVENEMGALHSAFRTIFPTGNTESPFMRRELTRRRMNARIFFGWEIGIILSMEFSRIHIQDL